MGTRKNRLGSENLYIAWACFHYVILLYTAFSVLIFICCLFAGVVPCGGPKKSPHISSIVQLIFSFWCLEINEDILRNQKFIIG